MSDLNLLPSQAKFQAQKMHLKSLINMFLWIFGGFWVVFLIIVLGIFLICKVTLDQLTKTYEKNETQYKSLVGSMATNQKVKYQAKVVAKVLSDRFEYGDSMEMVKTLFPSQIIIENIEIKEKKQFVLTGSDPNGKNMDLVEDKIADINNESVDGFLSANLTSVNITADKGWVFKVEVQLK
jgi:type II secretory pathway component PulF